MEFNEKLQELRKNKDLTQEALAEALCVSRAAVSKWESGRGYPSIDSLKDISVFFSVTIDDLLSGEKILSIAETENKSNIKNVCNLLFGIADLFSVLLIILPLYPHTADGFVYSVSLYAYAETSMANLAVYWIMFLALIFLGVIKLLLIKSGSDNLSRILTYISLAVTAFAVFYLGLAREAYAVAVVFLLLIVKGIIFSKYLQKIG